MKSDCNYNNLIFNEYSKKCKHIHNYRLPLIYGIESIYKFIR